MQKQDSQTRKDASPPGSLTPQEALARGLTSKKQYDALLNLQEIQEQLVRSMSEKLGPELGAEARAYTLRQALEHNQISQEIYEAITSAQQRLAHAVQTQETFESAQEGGVSFTPKSDVIRTALTVTSLDEALQQGTVKVEQLHEALVHALQSGMITQEVYEADQRRLQQTLVKEGGDTETAIHEP